ncbi:MAG TPA: hypothetical protein VH682_14155 [Gemmataceae bacterium]|jgi:hypothetical protein
MPIQFLCPNCKTVYDVADDLAGKFIMCRACQKRGPVRSLSGKAPGSATLAASASAASPTRRNFLTIALWSVASVGAIATGAVLARKPWRTWGYTTELLNPDMTTRGRGRGPRGPRGPKDGEDPKEKKEGT